MSKKLTNLGAILLVVWSGRLAVADTEFRLKQAQEQKKHLFALFIRDGDTACAKTKAVFEQAEPLLNGRAVLHVAEVSDPSEAAFVRKYGIDRAPLPLTIVFAPNGAIVKTFVGKVVNETELAGAFASPALAEVMKSLQDRKLVLLCVQGKGTAHNGSSLDAARAAAQDPKASGAITVVQADPQAPDNADLLRQLQVDSKLKEATIFILVPPSTLAGKVEGDTTKQSLWAAIMSSVSSCSSGCGPSGCGPR